MKMELTVCSETSAYKIQTPRNYLEDSTQHSEHGESLIWLVRRIAHTDEFWEYIAEKDIGHKVEEIPVELREPHDKERRSFLLRTKYCSGDPMAGDETEGLGGVRYI